MSNDFPFNHFINFDSSNDNKDIENNSIRNNRHQPTTDKPLVENSFQEKQLLSNNSFSNGELSSINEEILDGLKLVISAQKYKAFFENTFIINSIDDENITFSVTTSFIKKMIENHYLQDRKQIIFKCLGSNYMISLSILNDKQNLINDMNNTLERENTHTLTEKQQTEKVSFKLPEFNTSQEIQNEIESTVLKHNKQTSSRRYDGNKSFDNFIVGPSNNMAYAFTLAVAKDPGKIYPQLYILSLVGKECFT
jgi:chromosomal replication initiator protein